MKKFISLFSIFVFILLLTACNASIPNDHYDESGSGNESRYLSESTPTRKIIYKVESRFDVKDLIQSASFVKNNLQVDEWIDKEVISNDYIQFKVRIKTSRLDDFMSLLMSEFQVRSFSKEGTDISLQYQDIHNKLIALNLQRERLIELYHQATLSDLITINQQLSFVEVEIQSLQGQLNVYDSLVEYSEVNITLYGSSIITKSPFFNRIANAFVDGFKALFSVLDFISIAFVSLIPFILVLGPIGYGIMILRKKKKAKIKKTSE